MKKGNYDWYLCKLFDDHKTRKNGKQKKKIKNIKKEKSQNPLRSFVNINIIIKYIMLYYYSMMAFKTNFFLFLNDLKI